MHDDSLSSGGFFFRSTGKTFSMFLLLTLFSTRWLVHGIGHFAQASGIKVAEYTTTWKLASNTMSEYVKIARDGESI